MQTKTALAFPLPWWWFIIPAYHTLWTVGFSIYSFADGNGMMQAFGIDTGGASDFIMLNSAGRYLALAAAMILGIWIYRSYYSILTALLARFVMDIFDLIAGLQAGIITNAGGIVQSMLMFLVPNLVAIVLLVRLRRRAG